MCFSSHRFGNIILEVGEDGKFRALKSLSRQVESGQDGIRNQNMFIFWVDKIIFIAFLMLMLPEQRQTRFWAKIKKQTE